MKESDRYIEVFNQFKSLLDIKDFVAVNELMTSFNKHESTITELKSILVITKSFKENEVISENRKKVLALLEYKLGKKLA